MTAPVLWALALGDFRERVRRPAYAIILIAAVGLGVLAVPAAEARWVILDVGTYRGVYTSAYVGLVTALTSAMWLTLVGFYLARDAIARDERTGVGQLLAAAPLRTATYLAGKFLSNLLLLGSMAAVLAVTALVLQCTRGESRTVDPVGLLLPFLLIALPMLAVTAAAALLFEAVPVLRGGFGNIAWFFVWMLGTIAGQSADVPLGGIGMDHVAATMRADLAAQSLPVGEFGLGLMYVDHPLRTFEWSGLAPTAEFVTGRVAVTLLAVAVALLPALWFHRFDRRPSGAATTVHSGPSGGATVYRGLPTVASRSGNTLGRLLAGELRVLLQGTPLWWWLGAGVLAVTSLLAPPGPLLAVVWIWPVLLWSRMGAQRSESGMEVLLGAYPAAYRRLLAEWGAGVGFTALVGLAAALRMAVGADWAGIAAWTGGVLFIPSLALTLGALSGTQRLFQVGYVALWYLIVNGLPALDFMGALRADGRPAGPHPLLVAGVALAALSATFAVHTARHARR